jgi:anthranilate phosphoribosyltransferase
MIAAYLRVDEGLARRSTQKRVRSCEGCVEPAYLILCGTGFDTAGTPNVTATVNVHVTAAGVAVNPVQITIQ